jgi:hypothetical protein
MAMRSITRFLVFGILAFLIAALVGGVWYQRRTYQHSVEDLKALRNELFALRPGETPYAEAKRIAERFGAVPYEPHFGGGHDCRDGYFEECVYLIVVPRRVASTPRFVEKIARWGLAEWNSTAHIGIREGKVQAYYLLVSFKNSDGKPRGVSVTQESFLTPRAVEARVSDTYAVSRNDIPYAITTELALWSMQQSLLGVPTKNVNGHGTSSWIAFRDREVARKYVRSCPPRGRISI